MASDAKIEGAGLGLRTAHTSFILQNRPAVGWFEVLFDNFKPCVGNSRRVLGELASCYPLSLHCVGMNLGSCDSIDLSYLKELKQVKQLCQAQWVSDHLCWTSQGGRHYHDLLPLPFTEEVFGYLRERIGIVQDFLGEQILVENISSYFEFTFSEMAEVEFLSRLCQEADCLLLLDINNIYVNAFNHGLDPIAYLKKIPKERVAQYHLAGHESFQDYLLDSHGQPICKGVWELFEEAFRLIGPRPVSIERDTNIPPFTTLYQEGQQAQELYNKGAPQFCG